MDEQFRNEVMRSLGRIEGELIEQRARKSEISALGARLSKLERWQSWLSGAWFVGAAGFAWILKLFYGSKP
jgi:hypothetical protein